MENETFIELHTSDDFDAFYKANEDALTDEVGDYVRCFSLACNQELIIGGGAAPLFHVGFVD